jgi:hypothetical protein
MNLSPEEYSVYLPNLSISQIYLRYSDNLLINRREHGSRAKVTTDCVAIILIIDSLNGFLECVSLLLNLYLFAATIKLNESQTYIHAVNVKRELHAKLLLAQLE